MFVEHAQHYLESVNVVEFCFLLVEVDQELQEIIFGDFFVWLLEVFSELLELVQVAGYGLL